MKFPIDQIWIEQDALDAPMTGRILESATAGKILTGLETREEATRIEAGAGPFFLWQANIESCPV